MKPLTALDLWKKEKDEPLLKTGSKDMDDALDGGLRKGIIEISGEAGSGKSQIVMQFVLQVCK